MPDFTFVEAWPQIAPVILSLPLFSDVDCLSQISIGASLLMVISLMAHTTFSMFAAALGAL